MVELKDATDVAAWRMCIGCGACVAACPDQKLRMVDIVSEGLRPERVAGGDCSGCSDCVTVCPGVDLSHPPVKQGGYIESLYRSWGPVLQVWEGHASDPDLRYSGSSGGMASALALYATERAGMHGVMHVGHDDVVRYKNKTAFSTTRQDLLAATGSRYAPASPCDGLRSLETATAPAAFVGKPCDVAGLRKTQAIRPELDKNIGVAIGIFCAGTPSTQGTLDLLAKHGIRPEEVAEVRYRGRGWPGHFAVRRDGSETWNNLATYAEAWDFLQRYRPYRCHLCPDSTAEFADISCGDPWYRPIEEGEMGSSLVLARTERGREIVEGAIRAGYVAAGSRAARNSGSVTAGVAEKARSDLGKGHHLEGDGRPCATAGRFPSLCKLAAHSLHRESAVDPGHRAPRRLARFLSTDPPACARAGPRKWQQPGAAMKILVAIASYGTNNDQYLAQLVAEYRSMRHDVHIVVLSNIRKAVPSNVELIVGLPVKNPWSLPFAHKRVFAERAADYDLYIYSEDDTLITQAHVEAFCRATEQLHEDEIAGFLRSEAGPDGTLYYSSIHRHYHWDPLSVRVRGDQTYAYFSNEHGACYMLTRGQLARAIASGGFVVDPHEGKYDMLVSAATDPYTQCGFRKLVCISRLGDFTCKHLTNKYVGRTGLESSLVDIQVAALLEAAGDPKRIPPPTRVEASDTTTDWAKSYYEPARTDVLELLPTGAKRVLSLGCGWGATEEQIAKGGAEVTAVPLDVIIGRVAQSRGIRVISATLEQAPEQLQGEKFDVILGLGILHLVADPLQLLRLYARVLSPRAELIVSYPNFSQAATRLKRITGRDKANGVHRTSASSVGGGENRRLRSGTDHRRLQRALAAVQRRDTRSHAVAVVQ